MRHRHRYRRALTAVLALVVGAALLIGVSPSPASAETQGGWYVERSLDSSSDIDLWYLYDYRYGYYGYFDLNNNGRYDTYASNIRWNGTQPDFTYFDLGENGTWDHMVAGNERFDAACGTYICYSIPAGGMVWQNRTYVGATVGPANWGAVDNLILMMAERSGLSYWYPNTFI